MKTYGLIGYPLKNTFSARYFTDKFSALGIDAEYRNFPLQHISGFPALISAQPLAGLNVTIPYKEAVIPYLDRLDETAREVGAVNTIRIDRNNHLTGFNTDIYGFERSVLPLLRPWHQVALVLGTGGASKAVVYVLEKLGIKCSVVSRQAEQGWLYEEVDKALIRSHQVIVNCTPLGMFPDVSTFPPIPYQHITDLHLVYDLIYLPEETLFLQYARQHGAVTKNGLEMLEQQAEKAWEIWQENR